MSDSEVGESEAEADPMRAAAKPHPFPNFSPVSPSSSDDGEEKNKAAAAVAPAPPEHAAAGNRQQRHAATSDDHGAASDDEFPTPALGDGMRESLTTRLGKCTWQPLPCSETQQDVLQQAVANKAEQAWFDLNVSPPMHWGNDEDVVITFAASGGIQLSRRSRSGIHQLQRDQIVGVDSHEFAIIVPLLVHASSAKAATRFRKEVS